MINHMLMERTAIDATMHPDDVPGGFTKPAVGAPQWSGVDVPDGHFLVREYEDARS